MRRPPNQLILAECSDDVLRALAVSLAHSVDGGDEGARSALEDVMAHVARRTDAVINSHTGGHNA